MARVRRKPRRCARRAEKGKGRISDRWEDVQEAWNQAIAKVREDVEGRKTEHDLHKAQRRADWAEDDARFAIDFAYSAIGEAEYAVLDASLARMQADENRRRPARKRTRAPKRLT